MIRAWGCSSRDQQRILYSLLDHVEAVAWLGGWKDWFQGQLLGSVTITNWPELVVEKIGFFFFKVMTDQIWKRGADSGLVEKVE